MFFSFFTFVYVCVYVLLLNKQITMQYEWNFIKRESQRL